MNKLAPFKASLALNNILSCHPHYQNMLLQVIYRQNYWCDAKINWEKPPETMLRSERHDVEIRIEMLKGLQQFLLQSSMSV